MRTLAAGKLDRRIRIERDGVPGHDGYRRVPGEAFVLAERWAERVTGAGSEKFVDAVTAATAVVVFRIRWSAELDPERDGDPPGVNPRDRVRYPATEAGRVHDIVSAVEIGRREGIEITTIARSDAQS